MHTRHIYIDCRSRDSGNPAYCQFILNRPLHDVKSIQIKSLSFANTIYNIDEYNNKLRFRDVMLGFFIEYEIVVPPGFYTPALFVETLNALMMAQRGDTSVTLKDQHTLTWSLSGYKMVGGSMSDVIGQYQPTLSGQFSTPLNLSSPSAIAVICKEAQTSEQQIVTHQNGVGLTPMLLASLQRGYGHVEVYEPQTPYREHFSIRTTDRLSFILQDPRTGRILSEITSWSLILEVTSN